MTWGVGMGKICEYMVPVSAGPPGTHILGAPLSLKASLAWGGAVFCIFSHYLPPWPSAASLDCQEGRVQYLQEMDRLSLVSMICASSVMFRVGGVME